MNTTILAATILAACTNLCGNVKYEKMDKCIDRHVNCITYSDVPTFNNEKFNQCVASKPQGCSYNEQKK